ncbi:MAG: hypothetical protein MR295_09750 [Ruminococcus bromii]|nr:hypothetical protein [Ruminococcus bromii]
MLIFILPSLAVANVLTSHSGEHRHNMALLALLYPDFKFPPAVATLAADKDAFSFCFLGIVPDGHFIPAVRAFHFLNLHHPPIG